VSKNWTTKELMKSSSPTPFPSIRRSSSENSRLKQEGKITQADYDRLYPTAENIPRMYCTPKIHKTGNPLRPIVDYYYNMRIVHIGTTTKKKKKRKKT